MGMEERTLLAESLTSQRPPRRVARIVVRIDFPSGLSSDQRSRLEHIARTCPVARSIHPDIVLDLLFAYPD